MGRDQSINDDIVVTQSSSIALLQERFRQLERMKEMREERELLRKLQFNPTSCEPPSGLLFFHLLTTTPRPRSPQPRQAPNNLSVWSGNSQAQYQAPSSSLGCMEVPLFGLLPTVIGTPSSSLHVSLDKFQDLDCSDDVDTSLHL